MKKCPRVVIAEWVVVWARVRGGLLGKEKKRTCLGTVGLYIAKTYQIARENGRMSIKSLSPTVGVKLSGTPNNP
jgi:hypothetical protein